MSEGQDDRARRLQEARAAAGFHSPTDAARAMGVAGPTYLGHENSSRGYGTSASRYADFFKVSLEWLLTGRGPMKKAGAAPATDEPAQAATPASTVDLNFQSMPKNLPVMGNASCGEDGLFDLNGQVLDYVRRPPRLMGVKDAYALWIDGDSMSPWREHGGLAVVHPHQKVRILDYVVVQLKPGPDEHRHPAYIKRLVKQTPGLVFLRQFNPPKDIHIAMSKVLSIHKILDWDEAMGF